MKMKKILAIFIALLSIIGVTACEYSKPNTPIVITPGEDPDPSVTPPEESDETFTVKLVLGGVITFTPNEYPEMLDITVYWTAVDGSNIYTAAFDEDGIAKAYGLDGDYRISLTGTPEGYTYNPNIYTATNDEKDVSIELLMLGTFAENSGDGSGMYTDQYNRPQYIIVTEARAYRAVVTSALAKNGVYFSFEPAVNGTYAIESLVDTATNDVNPKVDIYNGTFAFRQYSQTVDDGGESSTYTKNFKYSFSQGSEMVGNTYMFAIKADSRAGEYPVVIDFVIRREGSYESEYPPTVYVEPFGGDYDCFIEVPDYSTKEYTWKDADDNKIFDGRYYAFNEEDGYYWRIDPKTGKFVARLYAKITSAITCMGNGTPLNKVTEPLSSNLTIDYGDVVKCYKYFIEGGVSPDGEYIDGYANHCNADGVYPVTQELKDFLQDYATLKELFFADGLGWIEGNGYNTAEGDQWLFACGYYIKSSN